MIEEGWQTSIMRTLKRSSHGRSTRRYSSRAVNEEFRGYGFSEAARTQVGVQDFRSGVSVEEKIFHRSDLYNLIVRPAGYDNNFLRLYFREGGRVLGGLTMWRSPGAGNWTLEDLLLDGHPASEVLNSNLCPRSFRESISSEFSFTALEEYLLVERP